MCDFDNFIGLIAAILFPGGGGKCLLLLFVFILVVLLLFSYFFVIGLGPFKENIDEAALVHEWFYCLILLISKLGEI